MIFVIRSLDATTNTNEYPRDITLEKIAITDDDFHFFHVVSPLATHMGPHGPTWTRISF